MLADSLSHRRCHARLGVLCARRRTGVPASGMPPSTQTVRHRQRSAASLSRRRVRLTAAGRPRPRAHYLSAAREPCRATAPVESRQHEGGAHLRLQHRHALRFEPWILRAPDRVARRGMRQRNEAGCVVRKSTHGRGQGLLALLAEIARLCVGADQENESDISQQWQETRVPERRALGARRCIAGRRFARVTKAHRDDRKLSCVEERFFGDTEPRTEAISTRIVPRDARRVRFGARRLADDHDPRPRCRAHDRSRPKGQSLAVRTRADLIEKRRETRGGLHVGSRGSA